MIMAAGTDNAKTSFESAVKCGSFLVVAYQAFEVDNHNSNHSLTFENFPSLQVRR